VTAKSIHRYGQEFYPEVLQQLIFLMETGEEI
jgi:hypothetical protein